ncbi:MAG TPA: LamG-like jellyroll fold domain-containing protein, partial [Verrucomicrobiae bacterium]
MYSRLKSWVAGCLILLGMLAGENAHGQATGPGYALLLTNATLTITGISNTIPTNEITIEFWQRSSTSNSLYTFQLLPNASGNVCEAYLPYLNGQIMWMYGNTSSGTLSFYPSNPPTGYWQHFAFVASYASNYMAVYRNGVLEGRKTGMVPLTPGARNLVFGNTGAQSVELDEIRIWNQARSASQILTNMCRSLTGTESNLVAYWRCDEGTGTNALDSGPNGLTGGILRPIWEPSTAPVQFPGGTTLPVNGVTDNSAALRANLLAGGFDTQGWFRYGETTNYGSLTPPLTVAATNYNLVNVTNFISQLATGRIYHCQFICTNAAGTNVGRDFTFMTLFPFTANITANSASLRLTSTNPWLEPAAAWFRYGPTTNYATNTTKYIGGYDGFVLFYTATGLNPGSIYHYQLVVTNVYGTNYGVDYTFTTLSNNLATLTNLTLSTGLGALVPPFATATTSYQAAVANGYSTVAVVPTLTDSNATVQVAINGGPYTPVVSGNPSPDLPVVPGQNVINILVTAQNLTTTKLYVLNAFVDTNPIVVSTTLATGPGSLAAAINQANLFNSPHLIHLATNGLYVYSNADNYWYGPNALPPVAADITVEGHGACLQINNSNRLRFFYIGADPAAPATINYTTPGAGRLTLHQLTLQGGLAR